MVPMLCFRPQKKWAAVNFPACPSIEAHFMDLSQGLLMSRLRRGGWGSSWQYLLPTLPQLPPGRFRQCMAKMCRASQAGLLKHVWTHISCQKSLFPLSGVPLSSPRDHPRVCSPALGSSLCLRAPTALVLMPFFSCSPAQCPSPVTPGVPALPFGSFSLLFPRFLVTQSTCGDREGE